MEHAADCDGSCSNGNCPVPTQEQCRDCMGGGRIPISPFCPACGKELRND
jgi:hypothetical protein